MRFLITLLLLTLTASTLAATQPFIIRVVDQDTGRGVPLVALRTVNSILQYTDSAGVAVFNEPGLMSSRVFFAIESHGYSLKPDRFGNQGKALTTTPGATAIIKIKRAYPAQRLYRLTGAGIYRDSLIAGLNVPTQNPVLNGRVLGSDSVVTAIFQNKLHWFWGDTNRPEYPLGNFHVPGATSVIPTDPNFDPDVAINLHYFIDPKTNFAKETARMPGQGPTWIGGLTVLNENQNERMFAAYIKVAKPMRIYEHGLVEFNPQTNTFDHFKTFPEKAPVYPRGHPTTHTINNQTYLYFTESYPLDRVPAKLKSFQNLNTYQSFTCLKQGTTAQDAQLDRKTNGELHYTWKNNTPALSQTAQNQLVAKGLMKPDEGLIQLRDINTHKTIVIHRSSVYFNNYRNRWVLVGNQHFGDTSILGEMWYAEADTPLGPWVFATQIATHNKYSFYNPKQHPYFAKDSGRVIYFEGTYTTLFSGAPAKTPRYNYNQIMYKLELDDDRLKLPLAIYRSPNNKLNFAPETNAPLQSNHIAFFAHDRKAPTDIPIYLTQNNALTTKQSDTTTLIFYAPPNNNNNNNNNNNPPPHTTKLYEYTRSNGSPHYSTDPAWPNPDYQRARVICHVWQNPYEGSIHFGK